MNIFWLYAVVSMCLAILISLIGVVAPRGQILMQSVQAAKTVLLLALLATPVVLFSVICSHLYPLHGATHVGVSLSIAVLAGTGAYLVGNALWKWGINPFDRGNYRNERFMGGAMMLYVALMIHATIAILIGIVIT